MDIYNGMRSEEHSKIVRQGLKRLTDRGIELGPPKKATPIDVDMIIKLRRQGKPYAYIANNVGLSVGLVHKLVKIFHNQIILRHNYLLIDLIY